MNFWNMSAFALTVLAVAISFLLIKILNDKDQENVFDNFIVGIGCILLITASQHDFLDNHKEPDITDEVNQLKKKLIELENRFTLIFDESNKDSTTIR